jgi:hypothetical protein
METHGKTLITPENIVLANLLRRVDVLEKEIHELKTDAIIKKTELPRDILEENGILEPVPKPLRRGKGYRPLLISEVIDAKTKCGRNASACARYLNISYCTFRKYAKLYSLWEPMKGKWSVKP